MNTYRVIVEDIKQFIIYVEAEGVIEAEIKALLGEGILIESTALPLQVRQPTALRINEMNKDKIIEAIQRLWRAATRKRKQSKQASKPFGGT